MWRLALLVITLVGVVSANEISTTKVFRIKPKNDEQLEYLRSFDNDEENGVSFSDLFLQRNKKFSISRAFQRFRYNVQLMKYLCHCSGHSGRNQSQSQNPLTSWYHLVTN